MRCGGAGAVGAGGESAVVFVTFGLCLICYLRENISGIVSRWKMSGGACAKPRNKT